MPAIVFENELLKWARCHVARVAQRYNVHLDDLWDETVTALLRAAINFDAAKAEPKLIPGKSTPFGRYAATAVHRACWRYCVRGTQGRPPPVSLDVWLDEAEGDEPAKPMTRLTQEPSSEEILLALEAMDLHVTPAPSERLRGIGRP